MCYSALIETQIKKLAAQYKAQVNEQEFQQYQLYSQSDGKHFPPLKTRIYPRYYAPVVANIGTQHIHIRLMRYGVYSDVKDKRGKYLEPYNARLDKLHGFFWHAITPHHGLVEIKAFFEWVIDPASTHKQSSRPKKKLIRITPQSASPLFTPCIFQAQKNSGQPFQIGFAIITSEAPPAIMQACHGRCPIFIEQHHYPQWLQSAMSAKESINFLIKHQVVPEFIIEDDATAKS